MREKFLFYSKTSEISQKTSCQTLQNYRNIIANSILNQLTLKCTARSAWMHCKEKKQKKACGKVHDPAFKMTEIYFQEKLLCNLLVKNGNYWSFRLDFGNVNAQFRRNILGITRRSLVQREFHIRNYYKFMLHGLWCNVLMSHGC